MTRFHWSALLTAGLTALAYALGSLFLFAVAFAGFLTLLGLGVVLPTWRWFGPYHCHGPRNRRCVALTFDDGPDPATTPALLELLARHRVEAAFFVVGARAAAAPELTAAIHAQGHLLGNHSYEHGNLTNFYSTRRLVAELDRTQQLLQRTAGSAPRHYRPPIGLSNPNTFAAARALGLTVVGWDVRSLDTQSRDPAAIVARIERRLRPGSIVLLHDGGLPATQVCATVELLLQRLRARDFAIERLDRLLT